MASKARGHNYQLITLGIIGVLFSYFMPVIVSAFVGFSALSPSKGMLTDLTSFVMVASRLGCFIYSVILIVVGFKNKQNS